MEQNALTVPFVLLALVCAILAMAYFRLLKKVDAQRETYKERIRLITDEYEAMGGTLSGIAEVVNTSVGGLSKRLSESVEIAETLFRIDPSIFEQDRGLMYWLHANDQFLEQLAEACTEITDPLQRHFIDRATANGRTGIFFRIYEAADVPPPIVRKPLTRRLITVEDTPERIVH